VDAIAEFSVSAKEAGIETSGQLGAGVDFMSALTPLPTHVWVEGTRREATWQPGAEALSFVDGTSGLLLRSHWAIDSPSGAASHRIAIENRSGKDVDLGYMPSMVLSCARTAEMRNQWVEKGAGWSSEVGTHVAKIEPEFKALLKSSGYGGDVGDEAIPWACVWDEGTRKGFVVGVQSSARVELGFEAQNQSLSVTLGIDATGGELRLRVPAGKTIELPPVFVLGFEGGPDEAAHATHAYVRERIAPKATGSRFPPLINNSWGSQMDVSEALAKRMIDDAAAMGLELFGMDAGWFRGLGDWHDDLTKFPHGLRHVRDYAHEKGLLFGLWVAWTQGEKFKTSAEGVALDRPDLRDWFGKDYPADWEKPLVFIGADLCLAKPEAREWCRNELHRIVREYGLDMLEHDQRMVITECVRSDHGHTSHPSDVSLKSAAGYYEVMDSVRAEFPDLIFENCVNGGRMVDFGALGRCHYVCISDSYDPLNLRRAFYDSSYAVPPSMAECYITQHPGPTLGTFRSMIRSAMMGMCTIMCDTNAWSDEQKAAARRQFDVYKTSIRPLLHSGKLYHVSERPDAKRWDGMQYHDPMTGRGLVFAFRGQNDEPEHRFLLKGLNAETSYQVRYEDGSRSEAVHSGTELMKNGLLLTLPEAGTSEIVYVEAQ